jgi:hypothetical protein
MRFYLLASIMLVIGLALLSSHDAECAAGICGNECMSSVDCLSGCVCMKENPEGNGVCVSFD